VVRLLIAVDRVVTENGDAASGAATRLADSVEQALKLGSGQVIISEPVGADWKDTLYSENFACPYDGTSLPALEPRSFSFNTPHGACPTCTGLGTRLEVDPDLVLANKDLSLAQGAIGAWGKAGWNGNSYYKSLLESVAKHYGFSMDTPVKDLKPEQIQNLVAGVSVGYYNTGYSILKIELEPIAKWDFYKAVATDDHALTIQTADQQRFANLLLAIGVRVA